MMKMHRLVLVLNLVTILAYVGIVDATATFAQGDVFASGDGKIKGKNNAKENFKPCGTGHDPGWQNAIEMPQNMINQPLIINGVYYRCEIQTAGNCRDRSTAICWDPQPMNPQPTKLIEGGVKENVDREPRTNWYDKLPVKGGANSNNRPPLRGGASTGRQKSFQTVLNIDGQAPIYITYTPPYALNQPQPILPPAKGNKTFRSATGKIIRARKTGKLRLEITDLVLVDGGAMAGKYYADIPAGIVLP